MALKVLDCTLRDGGYYNQWDFSPEIVNAYLNAMAAARIDYVELGLRNFPKAGFLGPYAYTTESFLNRLDLPVGPIYCVMVDAKTILSVDMGIEQAVDQLFVPCVESKICMVRIAAHFHEIEKAKPIVLALKNKGYLVGFNLMQSGGKPCEVIAEKASLIQSWNMLDVLYFADSLGNMDTKEVCRIVSALRMHWKGELGIHAHNNMAKALDNTLSAFNLGVSWLDVTVTGMGRGAGNAKTENLLTLLSVDSDVYNPSPVYELVIRHFEPMQKSFGWGSNLLYFLGAQNDIHPTYIQNLLSDSHFGTDEIIGAIGYLSKLEGTASYNGDILESALTFSSSKPVSGSAELKQKFKGRELLIVANGPNLQRYLDQIEAYILERKPIVLAINVIDSLSPEYVDYYCISHNSKFLSEKCAYKKLAKPVILPVHRFADDEYEMISKLTTIYDYGLLVAEDEFVVEDSFCKIPYDVTAAYALSLAKHTEAEKITLIGFDGYDPGDIRQTEMINILLLFKLLPDSKRLTALTPSSYSVSKGSIYAPDF